MKIIITGQPGRVVEKDNLVITAMRNTAAPILPKDLPAVGAVSTLYMVYITRKQWQRVNESLKNPTDMLIVEGYPFFDSQLKVMSVFASRTTTKLLEAGKRFSQPAEAEMEMN